MKRLVHPLFCAALLLVLLSVTAFAGEGDVAINETNFPDAVFRQYVSDNFDKSEPKDGILSATEIAAVTKIDVQTMNVSSLKGIEYFTALEKLYCSENPLTSLDVSGNRLLQTLSCYSVGLTSLDVSQNTKLVQLHCENNLLTELDVSENTLLEILSCSNNQLTTLDLSNNRELNRLDCYWNGLTALDLSNNTNLEYLYCYKNQLTSLDLSKNTALVYLSCYSQSYTINVPPTTRTFDLTTLPGDFDVSKASNWNGGTVSGNTLTVDNNADTVTYTYDCENNRTASFTLQVTVHDHIFDQEIVTNDALKTPADCIHDAVYYKSCSCGVAGTAETFTVAGTKLGHDHSGTWQYQDGSGHWRICARPGCNEVLDSGVHTFGDWVEIIPPTGTEKGQKERSCVCGYTETVEISDNRVIWIEPDEATKTEPANPNSNTGATPNPATGANDIVGAAAALAVAAGISAAAFSLKKR